MEPLLFVTPIHKDVAERLRHVDMGLYKEVRDVLAVNKAQRHIRGGMATKRKYERHYAKK